MTEVGESGANCKRVNFFINFVMNIVNCSIGEEHAKMILLSAQKHFRIFNFIFV